MPTLTLTLPRPHSIQRQVLREARRFYVLVCGRRWGKSTLGIELVTRPMLEGYPVGWFAPTYKLLSEVWNWMIARLRPVVKRSNFNDKRIELITGGVLEFWTLEDPDAGRSRKYKRVIIDEAGLDMPLLDRWQAAIRPTLVDLEGDAWFMGTPKGHNDFETLFERGHDHQNWPDWMSWQRPTSDNPYLAPDEVVELRKELSEGGTQYAEQEIDAQFVDGMEVDRFLPTMGLWDACQIQLPPLDAHTPVVLATDAGESSDCFAVVLVGAHPGVAGGVACRYARAYVPNGGVLNYDDIQADILDLIKRYAVVEWTYDPFLMGQFIRRAQATGKPLPPLEPFNQGAARLEADKGLLDLIEQRRLAHNGDAVLRAHIDNANKKMDTDHRKLRIVKRRHSLKIDLAVALAMGAARWVNRPPSDVAPGILVQGTSRGWMPPV